MQANGNAHQPDRTHGTGAHGLGRCALLSQMWTSNPLWHSHSRTKRGARRRPSFRLPKNFVDRLVVGVNAPLLNHSVTDHRAPCSGDLPFVSVDRTSGGSKRCHHVSVGKDVFVRNPIVGTHREVASPAMAHRVTAAHLV